MINKKLKILYVDFAIPYLLRDSDTVSGGAAAEWLAWIGGIKKTGNEIGVLTWKGAKKFIDKELDFDIVESYYIDQGIPILKFLYIRFPKFVIAIKKYNPDVVIQMVAGRFTFLGAIISKMLGKTFIYRIASDLDVDKRINKKLNKREKVLYKVGLKNTDIFICQNDYQYKALKEKFPQKTNVILYPPFALKKNLNIVEKNNRSYIAWMGNFRYQKNVAALIPIAKSLPDINFKITGKAHNDIDKVSLDALEELKILKNVQLIGYIKTSDILPFLSNAIALLNTSYIEGFPLTFLEACSVGTPIISTQNVNPNNFITKHQLGIVAESYEELPQAVKKLTDYTTDEDMQLRIRCRDYVEKYHNPEILARKLIEIIQNNMK